MRKRTKSREYALQILYQVDLTHADPQQVLQDFWVYHPVAQEVRDFAVRLAHGVVSHLEDIDRLIAAHANNWQIHRMAVVDRNILRLGVYELLHEADVPPKVCLNEAVELAKRFGDEESGRFVNGILDSIHKTQAPTPELPPDSTTTTSTHSS